MVTGSLHKSSLNAKHSNASFKKGEKLKQAFSARTRGMCGQFSRQRQSKPDQIKGPTLAVRHNIYTARPLPAPPTSACITASTPRRPFKEGIVQDFTRLGPECVYVSLNCGVVVCVDLFFMELFKSSYHQTCKAVATLIINQSFHYYSTWNSKK